MCDTHPPRWAMQLVPAGGGPSASTPALQAASQGPAPTQLSRCAPPAVPPALPGTQHHHGTDTRLPASQRLFSSRQSKSGDSKEGLKLQEVPPSSWTTLKPAWSFNKLGSFLNNSHSSQLEVLRRTCIQSCPSVSAAGPTVALPSPPASSKPDVRHHRGA